MPVSQCGRFLLLFCHRFLDFRLVFGQTGSDRQISAMVLPFGRHKCGSAANAGPYGACQNRADTSSVVKCARSWGGSSMFSVFVPCESSLKKVASPELSALPES